MTTSASPAFDSGAGSANGDSVLIYVAGANHDEIFRNRILGASMSGIYVGDESDPRSKSASSAITSVATERTRLDHGIYLGHVRGGVVANNVVIENMAIGVKVAPEANAITVTQNTVVANGRAGISIGGEESWSSNDNVVVNNIVAFNREWESGRTGSTIGHGNLALRNLVFGNGGGPFWFSGGGMAEQQSIRANPRFLADGTAGSADEVRCQSGARLLDAVRLQGAKPAVGCSSRSGGL